MYPPNTTPENGDDQQMTLKKILLALGGGGGAGGGSSPAGAPVTLTSVAKAAGQSGSIPLGAKGWTFTILTGTATFNGVAALPAGFSESDVNTLAAAITYAFDTPGTGYVRYNT